LSANAQTSYACPCNFWKFTFNIAGMQVGRINPGDKAIMVLNVDSEVPDSVMEEIRGMPGIFTATFARVSSEKISRFFFAAIYQKKSFFKYLLIAIQSNYSQWVIILR